MKITIGERCSGKTTRLIERSAREQLYILVSNERKAKFIFNTAKKMGLVIPYPVTVSQYLYDIKFRGSSIRRDGLLIDDAESVLWELLSNIPIHEITLTDHGNVEQLSAIHSDTLARSRVCQAQLMNNDTNRMRMNDQIGKGK